MRAERTAGTRNGDRRSPFTRIVLLHTPNPDPFWRVGGACTAFVLRELARSRDTNLDERRSLQDAIAAGVRPGAEVHATVGADTASIRESIDDRSPLL
jgi:hypothetical protein